MNIFYSIKDLPEDFKRGVITIGNFDGIHKGHQKILAHLCAVKNSRPAGVLTFSPHPIEYLYPEKKLFRLSSDQQKAKSLSKLGADFVILQKLDSEFLSLDPEEFITQVLEKNFQCQDLIVGDDFTFGHKASGSLRDLVHRSFKLHVIPSLNILGTRCSSTAIRNYLAEGDLLAAHNLLGHNFVVVGSVIKGQGLARKLGFNTANMKALPNFNLKRGVYATLCCVNQQRYLSATNVGIRPSVSDNRELIIETHCIDQNIDLDGAELEIFFISYIREEIKFASLDFLQTQVHKDITHIRELYGFLFL